MVAPSFAAMGSLQNVMDELGHPASGFADVRMAYYVTTDGV
jgi:hypothetical protein